MPHYTIEDLMEAGAPYALKMLMDAIKEGKPFITYGEIAAVLEAQLVIPKIFSTHIGGVAGRMIHKLLEAEQDVPLINVLITRSSGIPGSGVGSFLANRYRKPEYRNWNALSRRQKMDIVDRERQKVLAYPDWDELAQRAFNATPKIQYPKEKPQDYEPPPSRGSNRGGEAESAEHRDLKIWIAQHPEAIGLDPEAFGKGDPEYGLLSGDEVDVMFLKGNVFRPVEVKSCRSVDIDIERGLYQCVKYRAVTAAEYLPYTADVEAYLVTQRELTSDEKEKARRLNIKTYCITQEMMRNWKSKH